MIAEVTTTTAEAESALRALAAEQDAIKTKIQSAAPAEVLRLRGEVEAMGPKIAVARIVLLDAKMAELEQQAEAARANLAELEAQAGAVIEACSAAQGAVIEAQNRRSALVRDISMERLGLQSTGQQIGNLRSERAAAMKQLGATG